VSSDRYVQPTGTDLPVGHGMSQPPGYDDVLRSVSSITRMPLTQLPHRCWSRSFLVRCLLVLTPITRREIGERLGIARSTVYRAQASYGPEVAAVERVIGDERFFALGPGDLRRTAMWRRYQQVLAMKRHHRQR